MRACAEIGLLTWETSVWFDTKRGTYVLPVKAEIRKKLNLKINQTFAMSIWV